MKACFEGVSEFLKNNEIDSNYIGVAQLNSTAGDFEANSKKIVEFIKYSAKIGLKTLFFTPYSLTGYALDDVVKRYPILLKNCEKWLDEIAKISKNMTVILGIWQGFVLIKDGKIEFKKDGFEFEGIKVVSGEKPNIQNIRQATVYLNSVGVTDYKSFDGGSSVYSADGTLIARAKSFEEQLIIANFQKKNGILNSCVDLKIKEEFSLNYEDELEYIYKTLVQGIKDYFAKCGLKRAVLGLSGGLDSTVSAVLLVDALGKENVLGVSMPSKLTSDESKSDARILAHNLGIKFVEKTIKPMFETTDECLQDIFAEVEKSWDGRYKKSFTPDNIQARSRAMYLWGIANEFSSCIPIATSDKSELYMGYATINGDMSGGFATIADVTKTKLFALARWLNKNREFKNAIPESVIVKKPGAELAIDQNTGKTLNAEDALMPYEFLDEIIWRVENKNEAYEELLKTEFLYEKRNPVTKAQKVEWLDKFYKRMASSIYKGSIMPPYVVISEPTINKNLYKHPITAGKINYKSVDVDYIKLTLS